MLAASKGQEKSNVGSSSLNKRIRLFWESEESLSQEIPHILIKQEAHCGFIIMFPGTHHWSLS
jgi:hypothetical protein